MKKFKLLAWSLVATLFGTAYAADTPPKFDVQPGFKVTSEAPPAKAAEDAKPDADAKLDPTWFACRICVDHGNSKACGSGTPVHCEDGKTTILTNAHVVPLADKDKPITVVVAGRSYTAKYLEGSEVVNVGPNQIEVKGPDLCLLQIDYEIGHVALAEEPVPVGGQVWQFGYGGVQVNQGPTVKSGIVVKSRYSETVLTSTLNTVSGDSGSGVFNTRGELCGVTWGSDGQSQQMAVEVTTVRTFLARTPLKTLFPRLAARIAARKAARELSKLPPPMPEAPAIGRNGPCDPKLVAPATGAPKASPPATAAPGATQPSTNAPVGSGQPGTAGWQYDARRGVWWKWNTPGVGSAPNQVCPPGGCQPLMPMQPYGNGFNIVPRQNCPLGGCK